MKANQREAKQTLASKKTKASVRMISTKPCSGSKPSQMNTNK